jgi:hypothetical protein
LFSRRYWQLGQHETFVALVAAAPDALAAATRRVHDAGISTSHWLSANGERVVPATSMRTVAGVYTDAPAARR